MFLIAFVLLANVLTLLWLVVRLARKYPCVPRFLPEEVDEWSAYLGRHGYVVLEGALKPDEVREALTALWDGLDPADPDIPGTWRSIPVDVGGVMDAERLKTLRALLRDHPLLRKVLGDADLRMMGILRPWNLYSGWRTRNGYFDTCSLTAVVMLMDQGRDTGGVCVGRGEPGLLRCEAGDIVLLRAGERFAVRPSTHHPSALDLLTAFGVVY